MKTVEITLYRITELDPQYISQAEAQYYGSFLEPVTEIDQVWFTSNGLLYAIFN